MRPKAAIVTLFVVVVCTVGVQAQNDSLYTLETALKNGSATHDQQIELARLYIQNGRFYEAQKVAGRLLSADPNDAAAATLNAEATKDAHDATAKEVADAEARVKASGATDADRLALANAYYDAGSYAAAADLYGHLPDSLMTRDLRLRQARSLAWSSQLDPAERAYSRLLKEERTPDVELEYGRVLSWMGASRASVDTLRQVYRDNPNEADAVALANALAWSGNHDEAIQLLTDYTNAHPGSPDAQALLAQMRGAPDLRIERITRQMDTEPYNLALRVERARLNYDAGRYAAALDDIHFVRDHTNRKIDGLDDLERTAREKRDADIQANAARLKAIDLNNAQNADEILSLAKAYTGLEEYDQAISLYERYLRIRPNDTAARIQYARVLSWDQRYSAAERQYQKLIAENPDRADLQLEYAQALSYDSNFDDALHMFSSLTDLSDNPRATLYSDVPPKAYYNIGQIYRWYGWNDHAVMEQNRALALDSSYIPARQELDIARRLRPRSTLEARYSTSHDSDDFTLNRLDLSGEKWTSQRTGWNASIGRHEFEHLGDSVYATNVTGGINYRWNDNLLARANVGANLYDHGFGTRPFWGLGAQWMPNLTTRTALDYNHYDLIYDVFTLSSLTQTPVPGTVNLRDALSIDDFRGHYDYNGGGFFSWLADGSYGFISDDNRRAAAHGLATFRIFKEPFIALKADGRYLTYDFRTNRYWSPTDYKSLAGVLQIGQNIRNRFFWSVEGKLGNSWENGRRSNLRAYAANITMPVTDMLDAVASYNYGRSGRFNSLLGSSSSDFTTYWQRYWFVGIRAKQLFSRDERRNANPYYYDSHTIGSPVIPPLGETR